MVQPAIYLQFVSHNSFATHSHRGPLSIMNPSKISKEDYFVLKSTPCSPGISRPGRQGWYRLKGQFLDFGVCASCYNSLPTHTPALFVLALAKPENAITNCYFQNFCINLALRDILVKKSSNVDSLVKIMSIIQFTDPRGCFRGYDSATKSSPVGHRIVDSGGGKDE